MIRLLRCLMCRFETQCEHFSEKLDLNTGFFFYSLSQIKLFFNLHDVAIFFNNLIL